MIIDFVQFLSKNGIDYKITNGYHEIFVDKQNDSDYDILFKKSDFISIDKIIKKFCVEFNFTKVQEYHQGIWAKNIFLYNEVQNRLLNLDIYGEISRAQVKILNENSVFNEKFEFRKLAILSPPQEFIQYFIKKIHKNELSSSIFNYLMTLYLKDFEGCNNRIKQFFKTTSSEIINAFESNDYKLLKTQTILIWDDFNSLPKDVSTSPYKTITRLMSRINRPTGTSIAFLGPDGSGKSTIIDILQKQQLPFRKNIYFHLKPIFKDPKTKNIVVSNPHELPLYSSQKSYLKLLYFLYQYNFYWVKNIIPLKIRSSLVIFDRYFEDLLADKKRYRYGGKINIARTFRKFIFKPEIYFVLVGDAKIIHSRKKEVTLEELENQLINYKNLSNFKQFHLIDVNKPPNDIVIEITKIIMKHMNNRYV